MKYLKTYQLFESQSGLTREQEAFLNNFTKGTWSLNPATGLVDVEGDFDCSHENPEDFKGVKFGKVSEDFWCSYNSLTSLAGAPQEVGGYFDCSGNNLTSLAGAPQEIGGYFECRGNNLTSLAGAPQEIGGDFDCIGNKLTSLAGAPQKVGGFFKCDAFRLKKGEWNLEGWLKVLKESPEAQNLVLALLPAEFLNKEIAKDPAGMIMKLKPIWNDEVFKKTRSKLVWPKGYSDDADLVGDLDDVGF
jgi:hypothetical protein